MYFRFEYELNLQPASTNIVGASEKCKKEKKEKRKKEIKIKRIKLNGARELLDCFLTCRLWAL